MVTCCRRSGYSVRIRSAAVVCSLALLTAQAGDLQFPEDPALSPDGTTLYFSWNDDLWSVPSAGGMAQQITRHPARDRQPKISPDGRHLAFVSNRNGSNQIYRIDLNAPSSHPIQLTRHTAGYALQDWYPDGEHLLALSSQDAHWRHSGRFFKIEAQPTATAPEQLFDAYGDAGALSPDGQTLLFNREGYRWWRKGYTGAMAAQIWHFDSATQAFQKLVHTPTDNRWPLWAPDGEWFYYVSGRSGSFNLWKQQIATGTTHQLTHFTDDSPVFPCLSRDGSTLVFRQLAHFYRLSTEGQQPPTRIEITISPETRPDDEWRRNLSTANEVAFSADGLEVAFISGGDVWIMDTELREPKQVTDTVEQEHSLLFGPDDDSLYFVSTQGGQSDIWRAERSDPQSYWWLNDDFQLRQLTHDPNVETDLRLSPTGTRLAFLRDRGDIWVMDPDGKNARRIHESALGPDFDWSPDGEWLVAADSDADFNRDIWILSVDGTQAPFNVSRHPDNEYAPRWSPDGKLIAFTGRRTDQETDIYYVWLQAEEDERNARDRQLEKALKKMEKHRKAKAKQDEKKADEDGDEASETNEGAEPTAPENKEEESETKKVAIDFDSIHERIHRVSIPNHRESGLFWSADSTRLAFTATVKSRRGTYTLKIGEETEPKLLTEKTGSQARWIQRDDQVLWLSEGKPGAIRKGGKTESYGFKIRQTVSRSKRYQAAFEEAWRLMRDRYYDGNLGNKNWQAIRRKYTPHAAASTNASQLATTIQLMLGELNGSHLGFYPSESNAWKPDQDWNHVTAHLGLRFDAAFAGPGLKVRDQLPKGPAARAESRISPGEVILQIDGTPVDTSLDLSTVLNGPLDRVIQLHVVDPEGEERDVSLRPISYGAARNLLYQQWIQDNRRMVETASEGRLGYLHIRAMNWSSFLQFEEDLYAAGAGKDGLIIDVRENGGGFTTDHLLTALTQPTHAITVPRGGNRGYPHDRRVYATWHKPIAVLCNQNSFSNAEIFSHAIKHLQRGPLVGVPTAGGVISTGSAQIMDVGRIRMPFRGWYLAGSGEDMELHGAVPDHIVWPHPGEIPSGIDRQLDRAIEVLEEAVTEWKAQPQVQLKKASERIR